MFKYVLLAGALIVGGLWAAGYDLETISEEIGSAADENAGNMSGRSLIRD